jgi:Xaa-Pro aminopeptidase
VTVYSDRLQALREQLRCRQLDGFIIPLTDAHLSERIGADARRLAWLTGFAGSSATAVVLMEKAAIFVSGLYTLQVRQQVDASLWSYESIPETSTAQWLIKHAFEGIRVGYDPWLHTRRGLEATCEGLRDSGGELTPVESNPIDAIWLDRPAPSEAKMVPHPEKHAGKNSAEKRHDITNCLRANKADAVILASLDSVAWTFNIRGSDLEYMPVVRAFAMVRIDGSADLFVEPNKLTREAIEHLGDAVRIHPYSAFQGHLGDPSNKTVMVDAERTVTAIVETLERAGAQVVAARDPAVLLKAVKNGVEIAGTREAHVRDGVALSGFLHWLSLEAPQGFLTELSAAARLRQFREDTGCLHGLAWESISATGPNAALPHYVPSSETNRSIKRGSLYLIDSGGQYLDGTTDVCRTIAVGVPTAEMRTRFTLVLKGHIALAKAVFPIGTRGIQLDALARQYLWAEGLDYGHGTGHGVGSFLGIHEGPQRIAHTGDCSEPLLPGMILSNEPGYYRSGAYGIRIENLMIIAKREIPDAEQAMLAFETLTLAPIDRALIDPTLLSRDERLWLDMYHARVRTIIAPRLETPAQSWLVKVTEPLIGNH